MCDSSNFEFNGKLGYLNYSCIPWS